MANMIKAITQVAKVIAILDELGVLKKINQRQLTLLVREITLIAKISLELEGENIVSNKKSKKEDGTYVMIDSISNPEFFGRTTQENDN